MSIFHTINLLREMYLQYSNPKGANNDMTQTLELSYSAYGNIHRRSFY